MISTCDYSREIEDQVNATNELDCLLVVRILVREPID